MHDRTRRASSALALPLLAVTAAPAAAGDLTVGPPGSGADFTEIAAALAVAVAGDTIHVAAGSYDAFTVDLPVQVLGAGSGLVEVQSSVSGVGVGVRDIPAAAEAVLSGMTLLEAGGGFAPFVLVEDNGGNVVLHDLVGTGVSGFGTAFVTTLVEVVDSAHVVLERCSFTGEDATSTFGGKPLTIDSSNVWVAGSTLIAGATGQAFFPEILSAASGIEVEGGGTVRVASSFVQGGLSGSLDAGVVFPGSGGSGIFVEWGSAVVSGGPGNTIRGGDADPDGPAGSDPGYALLTTFFGNATYAADAALEGGLQLDGEPGPALPAAPHGSLTGLSYARAVLATTAAQVAPGGAFDLDFSGNELSPVGTFVALGTDPFLVIADVDGLLAVDLATLFVGPSAVLDGSGLATSSVSVPPQPGLAGTVVVFQSVELGSEAVSLSNPALVVIGS